MKQAETPPSPNDENNQKKRIAYLNFSASIINLVASIFRFWR